MKFFIDTANVEEIRKANDMGIIAGVTTNPSLIAKEGRDYAEQLKTVAEKYEEYFNPTEPAPPSSPQFGAEVKGQMPSGKTGSTFEDIWRPGR